MAKTRKASAAVFLDTGVLVAAALPRDPGHRAAFELLRRLVDGEWRSAHTSDYVAAEALNFVRMKVRRADAAEAVLRIVFGAEDAPPVVASVLRIHSGVFAQALDRFRGEFERGLSFTDWTTVVAMNEAGIRELATFDGGFRGIVEVAAGLD